MTIHPRLFEKKIHHIWSRTSHCTVYGVREGDVTSLQESVARERERRVLLAERGRAPGPAAGCPLTIRVTAHKHEILL